MRPARGENRNAQLGVSRKITCKIACHVEEHRQCFVCGFLSTSPRCKWLLLPFRIREVPASILRPQVRYVD